MAALDWTAAYLFIREGGRPLLTGRDATLALIRVHVHVLVARRRPRRFDRRTLQMCVKSPHKFVIGSAGLPRLPAERERETQRDVDEWRLEVKEGGRETNGQNEIIKAKKPSITEQRVERTWKERKREME